MSKKDWKLKVVQEQKGLIIDIRILKRTLELLEDRYKANEDYLKEYVI